MISINIQQFQGTSEGEDLQSALQSAIAQAIEAFIKDTADQRIAWKLIEISGSRGGFIGERTVTVTIEA